MDDVSNIATADEQSYTPTQGTPQGTPAADAGAQSAVQQANAAQEQHHNAVGKIYHAVLNTLGGTDDVSYSRDPQSGKLVTTQIPKTPGRQWKTILAGALTGMAAGATTKAKPGAPVTTGLGAGFNAVQQKNQEQDTTKRAQATEDFEAQQQATLRKAQVAMMTQQTTAATWKLGREQVDAKFQDAERENAFMKAISLDGNNRDLGVARNVDDLMQMHKDMPDLLQQQAHGNIYGIPHINEQGKVDGMRYALVNADWKEKRLDQDQTLYRMVPGQKPGDPPTVDKQTVKAGTMTNGEYMGAQQASNAQFIQYYEHQQTQAGEDRRLRVREEGENTRAAAHEAGENTRAELSASTKKAVASMGAGRKDILAHDKAYIQPAETAEQSYQKFMAAYNDRNNAKTGAASMQALSQHLATTFGSVKGARITKDMIQEHLHARSVSDDMVVAINKLKNGDRLSEGQWNEFKNMIGQSRQISWETAAREAQRKSIPIDFLPTDLEKTVGAKYQAPKGATSEVYDKDGKTLLGHVVVDAKNPEGNFVPIEDK